jgi:hypothetical protein
VRWEAFFDDLEMQWEAAAAASLASEVADRTRREVAMLRLVDRLRPCVGLPLRFGIIAGSPDASGGVTVDGRLLALGADWLLVEEPGGREALVPMRSVLWVDGLSAVSARPGHEGPLAARLDLRYALRGLARDRAMLVVLLVDGTILRGVAHRVGADFLELAMEATDPAGAARTAYQRVRTVVLGSVALLRRPT